jgi:hypothetical protein
LEGSKRVPYTASNTPSYVPKSKRKQWSAIWNAAYEEKIKAGETKEKAESYAFAVASGKIKNKKTLDEDLFDLMKSGHLSLEDLIDIYGGS